MVNYIKPNGKKKHQLPPETREKIKPIREGESITRYARSLAELMFEGVPRDSGRPYFSEHLEKVACRVKRVILKSLYGRATVAAAWLHDVAEDIEGIDVINPFDTAAFDTAKKQRGLIYLNDLLNETGEAGKNVCYIVELMTRRKTTDYDDYFRRIFSLPESPGRKKELHILTAVVKVYDIWANTNPYEQIDIEELVKQPPGVTPEELEKLRRKYESKQRTGATNNLSLYLPLAEGELIVRIGKDNGLFDSQKVRDVLKGTYISSLMLYEGGFQKGLQDIENLGLHKGRQPINGYKWIADEIREEVAEGKLSIEGIVYNI